MFYDSGDIFQSRTMRRSLFYTKVVLFQYLLETCNIEIINCNTQLLDWEKNDRSSNLIFTGVDIHVCYIFGPSSYSCENYITFICELECVPIHQDETLPFKSYLDSMGLLVCWLRVGDIKCTFLLIMSR